MLDHRLSSPDVFDLLAFGSGHVSKKYKALWATTKLYAFACAINDGTYVYIYICIYIYMLASVYAGIWVHVNFSGDSGAAILGGYGL